MMWLSNLNIGKKLGVGFGIALLFTIASGIVSILELAKVSGSTIQS